MQVKKRNGTLVDFDKQKIINAIQKANNSVQESKRASLEKINTIASRLYNRIYKRGNATSVEEIQDMVETELMKEKYYEVAKAYVRYRYDHKVRRKFQNTIDSQLFEMLGGVSDYWNNENSNKNAKLVTTQRDYMAGIVSEDISKRYLLPEEVVDAHKKGVIHFHDIDYFGQMALHNCDLVNLEDMLQNGTVISGVMIEKPKSFSTACTVATQIIAQVASSQYGGQSISLAHLAPFVDISRKKIEKSVRESFKDNNIENVTDEQIKNIVEERVRQEVKSGVQTIQYQVTTLMTTNGQAPFITVFMYLNEVDDPQTRKDLALIIEETLNQRMMGVKNEAGVYITPAFPKLIYVLEENNIYKDSEFYYLTQLAAKCSAKRLVPDYISEKIMKQLKHSTLGTDDCYTCMGCRSFLTPDRVTKELGNIANAKNYDASKPKYYGRFNQGVVTVNLPDIALSSGKDVDKFWEIFDDRMELCHKALRCRHERLKGTVSDVAPILWQYGALARLEKGETIDKLLYDGYSTISLGYAGLWECVYYLCDSKLTEPEGERLGLEIMQKLNDYTNKWKSEENIDYSIYGTPQFDSRGACIVICNEKAA